MAFPTSRVTCDCGSGLRSALCCSLDLSMLRPANRLYLRQIAEADEARRKGDDARAMMLCLLVLQRQPSSLPALRLLAQLHADQGRVRTAETLLGRVMSLDPGNLKAIGDLMRLSLLRGDLAAVLRHARVAIRHHPHTATAQVLMATAMTETGRPELGEQYYRRALDLMKTRDPTLLASFAWNLKAQGRVAESRELYEESLAARPDALHPLLGYAQLEEAVGNLSAASALLRRAAAIAPAGSTSILMMQAVVAARSGAHDHALDILNRVAQGDDMASCQALMEKGRLLDKMGRYSDAFSSWAEGKKRQHAITGRRYLQDQAAALADGLADVIEKIDHRAMPCAAVAPGPQPIFLLGFPRSGTTLIEQTLSSHISIAAGDELPLIRDLATMVPRTAPSAKSYPEALAALWMDGQWQVFERLRDYYLQQIRIMNIAPVGTPWFTDKMPLNEIHLGLISLVFPASPMIHVLRHPLDVVLSVFANDLTHGMYCAVTLESAARHYVLTMNLVARYREKLPLRYLPVRYEDMVDDQEVTVRRMLDFIGLPFEARCLAFHENRRHARTASYAQVTEKLYDRSRYRYRNYMHDLRPVIPILEPMIRSLGYTI